MLKAYVFGEYAPDLAPNGTDRLTVCLNAYPVANGYAPVSDFTAITPALAASFRGGAAFIGSDGTASLISGTATNLYRYSAGAWVSVLGTLTAERWVYAQFGDNVIAANGDDLVSYDLSAGTAAAIGGAPTASDVATVRDFVVILEPDGDELMVRWSAFNDSTGWTNGTDQAGEQPLLSGGKGMKVLGGERGTILQASAIKFMTYVGGELVWQFDEVSSDVGCMARGSAVKVGELIFFLSERGFMMLGMGGQLAPIGAEKIDRTFFATYSREDIQGISVAADPRRHTVMWGMPGSPGKLWCYNWQLQRWSTIETSLAGLFTGFTSNVSIEALDSMFGNLDTITGSLDDPAFAGGNPLLLVANASNVIGTMSGAALPATFALPNVEPAPTGRSRVRTVRGIGDGTTTATIDARNNAGDAENMVSAGSARSNGQMPIRCSGRYLDVTLGVANWTFAQGVELEFEVGGMK